MNASFPFSLYAFFFKLGIYEECLTPVISISQYKETEIKASRPVHACTMFFFTYVRRREASCLFSLTSYEQLSAHRWSFYLTSLSLTSCINMHFHYHFSRDAWAIPEASCAYCPPSYPPSWTKGGYTHLGFCRRFCSQDQRHDSASFLCNARVAGSLVNLQTCCES